MSSFPTGGTGGSIGGGEGSIGGDFTPGNPEFAEQQMAASSGTLVSDITDIAIDPNLKPYQLPVPTNGGDTALVQAFVQSGSFGATVYKAYASTDGRVVPTATALATINSTTTAATLTCKGFPFVLVVLDTAHGSSGSYHSLQVTVTKSGGG